MDFKYAGLKGKQVKDLCEPVTVSREISIIYVTGIIPGKADAVSMICKPGDLPFV